MSAGPPIDAGQPRSGPPHGEEQTRTQPTFDHDQQRSHLPSDDGQQRPHSQFGDDDHSRVGDPSRTRSGRVYRAISDGPGSTIGTIETDGISMNDTCNTGMGSDLAGGSAATSEHGHFHEQHSPEFGSSVHRSQVMSPIATLGPAPQQWRMGLVHPTSHSAGGTLSAPLFAAVSSRPLPADAGSNDRRSASPGPSGAGGALSPDDRIGRLEGLIQQLSATMSTLQVGTPAPSTLQEPTGGASRGTPRSTRRTLHGYTSPGPLVGPASAERAGTNTTVPVASIGDGRVDPRAVNSQPVPNVLEPIGEPPPQQFQLHQPRADDMWQTYSYASPMGGPDRYPGMFRQDGSEMREFMMQQGRQHSEMMAELVISRTDAREDAEARALAQAAAGSSRSAESRLKNIPRLPQLKYNASSSVVQLAGNWAEWTLQLRGYINGCSPRWGDEMLEKITMFVDSEHQRWIDLPPDARELTPPQVDDIQFSRAEAETHTIVVDSVVNQLPFVVQKIVSDRALRFGRPRHLADAILECMKIMLPSGCRGLDEARQQFITRVRVKNDELLTWLLDWHVTFSKLLHVGVWTADENFSPVLSALQESHSGVGFDIKWGLRDFLNANPIPARRVSLEYLMSYYNKTLSLVRLFMKPTKEGDKPTQLDTTTQKETTNPGGEGWRRRREKGGNSGNPKDGNRGGASTGKEIKATETEAKVTETEIKATGNPKGGNPKGGNPKGGNPKGTGKPGDKGKGKGGNEGKGPRVCYQWKYEGTCLWGDRCRSQHGDNDKRDLSALAPICRIFASTGKCEYGSACRFRHSDPKRVDATTIRASGAPSDSDAVPGAWVLDCAAEAHVVKTGGEATGESETVRTVLSDEADIPVVRAPAPFGVEEGGKANLTALRCESASQNVFAMSAIFEHGAEGFSWFKDEGPRLHLVSGDVVQLRLVRGCPQIDPAFPTSGDSKTVLATGAQHTAWTQLPKRTQRIFAKGLRKAGFSQTPRSVTFHKPCEVPPIHDHLVGLIVDLVVDQGLNILLVNSGSGSHGPGEFGHRVVRCTFSSPLPMESKDEDDEDLDMHVGGTIDPTRNRVAFHINRIVTPIQSSRDKAALPVDSPFVCHALGAVDLDAIPAVMSSSDVTVTKGDESDAAADRVTREIKERRVNARTDLVSQMTITMNKQGFQKTGIKDVELFVHAATGHNPSHPRCEACSAKQRRAPHHRNATARAKPRTWHADTLGPVETVGDKGVRFAHILIDEGTDLLYGVAVRSKHSSFTVRVFEGFAVLLGQYPVEIHTDLGTEYQGQLGKWMQDNGGTHAIAHVTSPRYSPWRNGRAEKAVSDVSDLTRVSLMACGAPSEAWGLAWRYACDTINLATGAFARVFGDHHADTAKKIAVPFGTKVSVVREGAEKSAKFEPRSFSGFACGYSSQGLMRVGTISGMNGGLESYATVNTQNVRILRGHYFWGSSIDAPSVRVPEFEAVRVDPSEPVDLADPIDPNAPRVWAQCMSCSKWREIESSERDAVRELPIFECADLNTSCDVAEDVDTWLEDDVHHDVVDDRDDVTRMQARARAARSARRVRLTEVVPRREAINGPKATGFAAALQKELNQFIDKGVFDPNTICELYSIKDRKACFVRLFTIYGVKNAELDVSAHVYKARLVAGGNAMWGASATGILDGENLWSLPPAYHSLRAFTSLAILGGKEISSRDLTAAYLHAPTRGPDTYAVLPPEAAGHFPQAAGMKQPVALLQKAVYGTKRAGFDFEHHVTSRLELCGWRSLRSVDSEPAIYTRPSSALATNESVTFPDYLFRFSDDLLLAAGDSGEANRWKEIQEHLPFDGDAEHLPLKFVGVNISQHTLPDGKVVVQYDQVAYVDRIVQEFEVLVPTLKTKSTPLPIEHTCLASDCPPGTFAGTCRHFVMTVMFIHRCSRPDLAHCMTVLASLCDAWCECADKLLTHTFGYLKATVQLGVQGVIDQRDRGSFFIEAITDASFAPDAKTRKGVTGYVIFLRGDHGTCVPLQWRAKKQTTIATSSTEAEIVAIAQSLVSVLDLCSLAEGICGYSSPATESGVIPDVSQQIPWRLRTDSKCAIDILQKGVSVALRHLRRTQAVSIAWVADVVSNGSGHVTHVPGAENVADALTKQLPVVPFTAHRSGMGLTEVAETTSVMASIPVVPKKKKISRGRNPKSMRDRTLGDGKCPHPGPVQPSQSSMIRRPKAVAPSIPVPTDPTGRGWNWTDADPRVFRFDPEAEGRAARPFSHPQGGAPIPGPGEWNPGGFTLKGPRVQ